MVYKTWNKWEETSTTGLGAVNSTHLHYRGKNMDKKDEESDALFHQETGNGKYEINTDIQNHIRISMSVLWEKVEKRIKKDRVALILSVYMQTWFTEQFQVQNEYRLSSIYTEYTTDPYSPCRIPSCIS